MAKSFEKARSEHSARGHAAIKRAGYESMASTQRRESTPPAKYARGGRVDDDAAEDKPMIAAAVHKHENHDHKGEPLTKLARGGVARGKGGNRTQINILMPHHPGGMPAGPGAGVPVGPKPPMMAGPPPGAGLGAPPPPIMPGAKRGGRV